MEILDEGTSRDDGRPPFPKRKAKCDWYIYCESCDDLVIGECPKHSSPSEAEPENKASKADIQPKIVSVGSQAKSEMEEPRVKPGELSGGVNAATIRLVPAAHFEDEVSEMTEEEYSRSVVYIPCKKEIRIDEYGNEVLVYDVKQADGTILPNFYMTAADDLSTTFESGGQGQIHEEFRVPEAYPIKRVQDARFKRPVPPQRTEPDGQQIYACTLCGKRLTQSSSLTVHMRIHTGEKPYACEYCNKRFNHHSNMVKHERVHTGVQPYVCPYCGKSFNQSTHLKTHIFSNAHSRGRLKHRKLWSSESRRQRRIGRRRRKLEGEEEKSVGGGEGKKKIVERSKRRGRKSVALVHDGGQREERKTEEDWGEEELRKTSDVTMIKAEIVEEEDEYEMSEEENEEGGA